MYTTTDRHNVEGVCEEAAPAGCASLLRGLGLVLTCSEMRVISEREF